MTPIEYYTDTEINELIFKLGDVIERVEFGDKVLPDNMRTAWLMLQTAHSMLADTHPTTVSESKGVKNG